MSKTIALLSAALVCLLLWIDGIASRAGDAAHPDFTGVYYTFNPDSAGTRPRRGASAGGGTAAGPAAAATRGGYRRACGPAGDRAEADARVPGQMGGHSEVAHGRIV